MKTTVLFLFLLLGVTGYSQIGNKEIIMDLSKPELRIGIPEKSKDNLSGNILDKLSEEMADRISTQITNDLSEDLYANVSGKIRLSENESVQTDEQAKDKLADIISKETGNVLNSILPKRLSNEFSNLTFLELPQEVSDELVEEITEKTIRRVIVKTNEELTDVLFNNLSETSDKKEVTDKIREVIQPELSAGLKKELETKLKEKLYNGIDVQKTKWLSVKAREMPHIKIINGNPLKYTYKIDTRELAFFSQGTVDEKEVQPKKDSINEASNKSITSKVGFQELLNNVADLNKNVESTGTDFEMFYTDMKGRNSIDANGFESKRSDFFKRAISYYNLSITLLKELDSYKDRKEYKKKYPEVKNQLTLVKDKAEKLKDEIKKKLYGFDFTTFTLPIDVQGKNIDVIEFRLRRFDKETKEEDTGFAPHPYNVWIRDGFKIDISAGVYFSKLFDDVLDKKDDPAIAGNKIILKKNQGDYDFALGSSVNVHYRCNSWVSPGFNLGVAFTTNQKFQMLLGGHLVFGKQERLIFTTGVAVGKVERLADSYKVGGSYDLGAEGTIPTQTQFKFGHFFGVTYNLSKVKKISLEKGIEQ